MSDSHEKASVWSTEDPLQGEHVAPTDPSWHSLVANTPLFVLILNRDHRICFINHSQPNETPGHVIGKTPYDYCLPEQRGMARNKIARVFATGEPASYEIQAAHPDIGNVWYHAHLGPIFESDEVTAVSMIAVDITARKQAEQESNRARAVLNATIDCLPFEFFALDADGRYMIANAVARSRSADIIGKTPEEVCPNRDDLVLWLENNRRAFAGERVEAEVESTVSGERRHCYNVVTPIRDGDELYGILGVNMDITDRVLAEKALRESEERYRLLAESIPQSVWRCDADGAIVECNRRWYEYTGQTPGEAYGDGWMKALHPDDVARVAELAKTAIAAGKPHQFEYRLRRASDGSYRWHLAKAIPVKDEDGTVRDWFGSVVEIHDQKEVQTELEKWVDERTAELTAANKQLQREIEERRRAENALQRERRTLEHMLRASDHERQVIAYDIHDGLAQQLAAAIMQLQAYEKLKNQDAKKAEMTYASGVALAQRALTEARRLISGVRPPVLDEAGVAVAIAHLVHETREPDCPQIEYHDDVKFGRLPPILENAIYRIAQEAIGNACQHSRTKKVKVGLVQEGDQLRLEVRDWGIGLVPETVPENCFGLDGIRERTRLLGGEVAIESEPGKGTCVRVMLPLPEHGNPQHGNPAHGSIGRD